MQTYEPPFNPGDRVRALRTHRRITNGDLLTVNRCLGAEGEFSSTVAFEEDMSWHFSADFELAEEPAQLTLWDAPPLYVLAGFTEEPPLQGYDVCVPTPYIPTTTSVTVSAPDANPKTRFGMAKPPLSLVPAGGLVHMAQAFADGASKYGPANWRQDPVSTSTYLNAALRHIVTWQDGEEVDPVSKVHHLGHAAACLAILLDAQMAGTLLDDRPPPAPTGDLIRTLTKPLT